MLTPHVPIHFPRRVGRGKCQFSSKVHALLQSLLYTPSRQNNIIIYNIPLWQLLWFCAGHGRNTNKCTSLLCSAFYLHTFIIYIYVCRNRVLCTPCLVFYERYIIIRVHAYPHRRSWCVWRTHLCGRHE